MKEFILWGTEKGKPSYMEEVLAETKSKEELEKAKARATDKGYINLRVLIYGGERPDFTKVF